MSEAAPESSSAEDDLDPERRRLANCQAGEAHWLRWGPYLAARQWGTVREDYSADGEAWTFFPHDHARSRAYRWGEDGLLGFCDESCLLCFGLALWNEADPILKERLFGLNSHEGNHGEDVKEYWFDLDNTPTHSYMRSLYRYPQRAFSYDQLIQENHQRTRQDPEFELIDTGVLAGNRFFDIEICYAKAAPDDIVIRIDATNRGPEPAPLHLVPQLWFRNTWAWGLDDRKPCLSVESGGASDQGVAIRAERHDWAPLWLVCQGAPELLFTDNETNNLRLWQAANRSPYVKDGINDAIVQGQGEAVNPARRGTKAAARYRVEIAPGATESVLLRLTDQLPSESFADAVAVIDSRAAEADLFYQRLAPSGLSEDERLVQRRALAGLLGTKQFYDYDVNRWLDGDPAGPVPPAARKTGRNHDWRTVACHNVLAMPAAWEYPWFAAWDLAFHALTLTLLDSAFAKRQLILLGREWYQHPSGQLPAYEWSFGDVNPPVQAWAAWRIYKLEQLVHGSGDRAFLERVFHKLMINFTWWVNRKDVQGENVFAGGFLGMDNISLFDRSTVHPGGGVLEQSDGTAWMAMYCLNMVTIALELAQTDRVYADIASKFFEHFLGIAQAMDNMGACNTALWDDADGFFYDVLRLPNGEQQQLRVRSLVGLIPLLAVDVVEPETLAAVPAFQRRLDWLLGHRPDLAALVSRWHEPGAGDRRLLALTRGHRMKCLLRRMLDPAEFLSDHGIRSLSKYHAEHPFVLTIDGRTYRCDYEPGESTTGLFGGNSNWRGPVWFPLNYLLIDALRTFHRYYGDEFLVECPTGSGQMMTLRAIADDLASRLISIFTLDAAGKRAMFGANELFQTNPLWRDNLFFSEYFHGETGAGLGASHQTGWTALVALLLNETARA